MTERTLLLLLLLPLVLSPSSLFRLRLLLLWSLQRSKERPFASLCYASTYVRRYTACSAPFTFSIFLLRANCQNLQRGSDTGRENCNLSPPPPSSRTVVESILVCCTKDESPIFR